MPQPYNIKTSSNKPSLGSTNVKKTPVTLMTQMYKPEKKDKPKSGVKNATTAIPYEPQPGVFDVLKQLF